MPSDRPDFLFSNSEQVLNNVGIAKWDETLVRLFGPQDNPTNYPTDVTDDKQPEFQAIFDELDNYDAVKIEILRNSVHIDAIAQVEGRLQESTNYINSCYDGYMSAMQEMVSPSEDGRAKLSQQSSYLLDDTALSGTLSTLCAELLGAADDENDFGFLTEASKISERISSDFLVHFLTMQAYTQKYVAVQLRGLFLLMAMNRDHKVQYESAAEDIELVKKDMAAEWKRVRKDLNRSVFDLAFSIFTDPTKRRRVFIRSKYNNTWLERAGSNVNFDGEPENRDPNPWYLELTNVSSKWDIRSLSRNNTFNLVEGIGGRRAVSKGDITVELGSDDSGAWRLKGRADGTFHFFWVATSDATCRFDGWVAMGNVDRVIFDDMERGTDNFTEFMLCHPTTQGHDNLLEFLIFVELPY